MLHAWSHYTIITLSVVLLTFHNHLGLLHSIITMHLHPYISRSSSVFCHIFTDDCDCIVTETSESIFKFFPLASVIIIVSKRLCNSKDTTVSTTSLSLHVNKVYCHSVSAALHDCSQLYELLENDGILSYTSTTPGSQKTFDAHTQ